MDHCSESEATDKPPNVAASVGLGSRPAEGVASSPTPERPAQTGSASPAAANDGETRRAAFKPEGRTMTEYNKSLLAVSAFFGIPREAWRDRAACVDADPRIFFPGPPRHRRPDELARYNATTAQAKAVCATCPSKGACLAFALAQPRPQDHGIYGGTTERERDKIRRARRSGRAA